MVSSRKNNGEQKMTDNKQLAIVGKIETQLRKKREQTVFPLTPTHRKELRVLRDENIGSLRTQIRFIKTEKKEEFKEKFRKQIEKEADKVRKVCEELNKDWEEKIGQIEKIIQERKTLEEENQNQFLTMTRGYEVSTLFSTKNIKENYYRRYTFDLKKAVDTASDTAFEERYGEPFKELDEKIKQINTAYEEAINFGDLEIVKELYYQMKDAEQFLEKIRKMKV